MIVCTDMENGYLFTDFGGTISNILFYDRDLPYPLLTHEYLHIFASVEGKISIASVDIVEPSSAISCGIDISEFKDKILALNLLVLLLPTEHRDTLKVSHKPIYTYWISHATMPVSYRYCWDSLTRLCHMRSITR
jgi:hypothetical protein